MSVVPIYTVLKNLLEIYIRQSAENGRNRGGKTEIDVTGTFTASWNIYNPIVHIRNPVEPHLKTFNLDSPHIESFFSEFIPVEMDNSYYRYTPILFSAKEKNITVLPCFFMRNNVSVIADDDEKFLIRLTSADKRALASYLQTFADKSGEVTRILEARSPLPPSPPLSTPSPLPSPRTRPGSSSPASSGRQEPNIQSPHRHALQRETRGKRCQEFEQGCRNEPLGGDAWCDHDDNLLITDSQGYCLDLHEILLHFESGFDNFMNVDQETGEIQHKYVSYPRNPWNNHHYTFDELAAIYTLAAEKGIEIETGFSRFYKFMRWMDTLRNESPAEFKSIDGKEFATNVIKEQVGNIVNPPMPEPGRGVTGQVPRRTCEDFELNCDNVTITGDEWCDHPDQFLLRDNRGTCFDLIELFRFFESQLSGSIFDLGYPRHFYTGLPFTLEELNFLGNSAVERGMDISSNFTRLYRFLVFMNSLSEENLQRVNGKKFPTREEDPTYEIRRTVWSVVNNAPWSEENEALLASHQENQEMLQRQQQRGGKRTRSLL
jgi:hypothetical protein